MSGEKEALQSLALDKLFGKNARFIKALADLRGPVQPDPEVDPTTTEREPEAGPVPQDCAAAQARDSASNLWFRLDEIEAVAGTLEIVQLSEGATEANALRVGSLCRVVVGLAQEAKRLHSQVERGLLEVR